MRLLEFGVDEGGANPIPARQRSLPDTAKSFKASEKTGGPIPSRAASHKPALNRAALPKKASVFPLKSAVAAQVQRKPIDLEQLQHRVAILEQRIKARAEALGDEVTARDFEMLKQRMKLLERNIENELWAAKQREYSMLQELAKPTLNNALRQGYSKFLVKTLPALLHSLRESSRHWWLNNQPGWWYRFAAAWQESLDKARGQTRN